MYGSLIRSTCKSFWPSNFHMNHISIETETLNSWEQLKSHYDGGLVWNYRTRSLRNSGKRHNLLNLEPGRELRLSLIRVSRSTDVNMDGLSFCLVVLYWAKLGAVVSKNMWAGPDWGLCLPRNRNNLTRITFCGIYSQIHSSFVFRTNAASSHDTDGQLMGI